MSALGVPNAMWWAQAKLTGGMARVLTYAGVWLLLVVIGVATTRHFMRNEPPAVAIDTIMNILGGAQPVMLIILACNSIFRAMVRDVDSAMLESHRLTPMSASSVIIGYMIGPILPILAFFVINFVTGLYLLRIVGTAPTEWLLGNAFLLLIAPLLWTLTVLMGIARPKPFNPLMVFFFGGALIGPLMMVPGLGVFTGFFAGVGAVPYLFGSSVIPPSIEAMLVVITAVMTVIWFRAAARKFHRPDLPAFGIGRAFALLLIWLVMAAAPAVFAQYVVEGGRMFSGSIDQEVRSVLDQSTSPTSLAATMDVSILIALFPIAAVAAFRLRSAAGGWKAGQRRLPGGLGSAAAATFVMCLVGLDTAPTDIGVMLLAWLAVWVSLTAIENLFVIQSLRNKQATKLVVLFILFLWGAPLLVDTSYREFQRNALGMYTTPPPTLVQCFSPFGVTLELFSGEGANMVIGVIFQVGVALIIAGLAHRALRRRQRAVAARKFCMHCDYDLTGNKSGTCPECGKPVGTGIVQIGPNVATPR